MKKERQYPLLLIKPIQHPSKFWALPLLGLFIKMIILFPVSIMLYILTIASSVVTTVNSFSVLLTGRYSKTAYALTIGLLQVTAKTNLFLFGLTDTYPGFDFAIHDNYQLIIGYPTQPSRLYAFPVLGFVARYILMIPFMIYAMIVSFAAILASIGNSFYVLITGFYSDTAYELAIDSLRVTMAQIMFMNGLSDTYPSFSISLHHKRTKILLFIFTTIFVISAEIPTFNNILFFYSLIHPTPVSHSTGDYASLSVTQNPHPIPGWQTIQDPGCKGLTIQMPQDWQKSTRPPMGQCDITYEKAPNYFFSLISADGPATWNDILRMPKYATSPRVSVAGNDGVDSMTTNAFFISHDIAFHRNAQNYDIFVSIQPRNTDETNMYKQIIGSITFADTSEGNVPTPTPASSSATLVFSDPAHHISFQYPAAGAAVDPITSGTTLFNAVYNTQQQNLYWEISVSSVSDSYTNETPADFVARRRKELVNTPDYTYSKLTTIQLGNQTALAYVANSFSNLTSCITEILHLGNIYTITATTYTQNINLQNQAFYDQYFNGYTTVVSTLTFLQ